MSRTTKEYREKIEKLEKENEALAKTLRKTTVERNWTAGKLKSLDLSGKRTLLDSKLDRLSPTRQCQLPGLNRSSFYYRPVAMSQYDVQLVRRIDEIYTIFTYGYRKIHAQLKDEEWATGDSKVHRLMQRMGVGATLIWTPHRS